MPFFEEAVKGCFIRVGIGAHEGKMVYRVSIFQLHYVHVLNNFICEN